MSTSRLIKLGFAAAAVMLTSAATVSKAADVAPDARPYYLWSGLYAGGNLGFGWLNSGDSKFAGGGQLGYNWQNGRWVFGAEGDLSTVSIPGVNSTASIAGRVGYEITPRWLLFGKFGAGWLNFDGGHVSGALFGVGAEYAFAQRWSAKIEYNHVDLGGSDFGSSSFNSVKAGVNYKFGPGWPF